MLPESNNWNGEIWTHAFCVISTALYHWVTFHCVPLVGNDPTLHRLNVSYKKTTLWGRFLSVWVQHTYLKLLYQVEPYVTVPTARASGNNRIWTDNTLIFNQVLYQLELCSQSLRGRIWTCDLSVPNTQLYQTELLPEVFLTGFEPVLPPWKGGDLTASR